jgi:hypothetical protein
MVTSYFAVAEGCAKYLKYKDHRIFIPVFLPLVFWVSSVFDTPEQQAMFHGFSRYVVLFFNFIIIPVLVWLVWRKKGSNKQC